MAPSGEPVAELSHLPKADGSATFSYCGYTVTASVNGPVEAQRRDENPFEAIVDVNVRPAAGVGGTAERQLESIVQAALRQLIPIRNFPRTLIQVTLQIIETPQNVYTNPKIVQAQLNLSVIPALLHAAVLGLLTGAVPMKTIAAAATFAIPEEADGNAIILHPSTVEADRAKSVHVLGFTSDEELLLAESKGSFSPDEWNKVLEIGQRVCCRRQGTGLEETMEDSSIESASILDFMRAALKAKTAADLHWK